MEFISIFLQNLPFRYRHECICSARLLHFGADEINGTRARRSEQEDGQALAFQFQQQLDAKWDASHLHRAEWQEYLQAAASATDLASNR